MQLKCACNFTQFYSMFFCLTIINFLQKVHLYIQFLMFFNININIVVNYLLWCFCVVSLNQNFKKMPKQVILYFMCVYVCTCISLSYHLTFYYQLISLLNTKNNLNVVFLFILIYCGLLNRKKNYLLFFMFVLLLSFVTFTTSN